MPYVIYSKQIYRRYSLNDQKARFLFRQREFLKALFKNYRVIIFKILYYFLIFVHYAFLILKL
jgi:hypothetical protein